jgi:hypothetical protein
VEHVVSVYQVTNSPPKALKTQARAYPAAKIQKLPNPSQISPKIMPPPRRLEQNPRMQPWCQVPRPENVHEKRGMEIKQRTLN